MIERRRKIRNANEVFGVGNAKSMAKRSGRESLDPVAILMDDASKSEAIVRGSELRWKKVGLT